MWLSHSATGVASYSPPFKFICIRPGVRDSCYVSQARIVHLDSLTALRAAAEAWDDLWRRSDVTLPSLRAELVAQWVEQFSQPHRFHAIAVESEGRLVAALPLIERKLGHLWNVAAMPSNEWSSSGDLLLDDSASDGVLDTLAAAMGQMPWPLLWLDEVVLDARRWQRLHEAMVRAGMTVAAHRRWSVGRVEANGDWPAYKARWSRKHRQKMAWAARRLAERGDSRLLALSHLPPEEAAPWMCRAFEIEDRSWKGAAGSSVLRSPDIADFFIRQAQEAARWGQLELVFLQCGDRLAAFSYGLAAKGVFHSLKVGYDRQFAEQVPGQLLRYYLLERLFAQPERAGLDFLGPMTEAHAAWLPEPYTIGRLAVAPRRSWGRVAVRAYKDLWLRARRGKHIGH
jgi:CelD/BcsL family acetyltransferase involved in cellulose biosynthesis